MQQQHINEAYLQKLQERAKGTFWEYLGSQVESVTPEKVVLSLQIEPHHLNPLGIVHGGVTSSMLDNAMGLAAFFARPNEQMVTTNLNVHFVAPLRVGKITVTAEIVHQSRKMVTTYGTVTDENGVLGTMGTGSFRVIS